MIKSIIQMKGNMSSLKFQIMSHYLKLMMDHSVNKIGIATLKAEGVQQKLILPNL